MMMMMFIPDDDGFLTAGYETETQFWVAREFYVTRLRRLFAPVLARVFVRRRFVDMTAIDNRIIALEID